MNDSSTRSNEGISRRSVAKGMAWSVPVVAVATAAPAIAASGTPPKGQVNKACKQPGNSCGEYGFVKGYTFTVTITNTSNKTIYVYTAASGDLAPDFQVSSPVDFDFATANLFNNGQIGAPLPLSAPIAPGGTLTIIINAGTNSNSANTSAVGNLSLAWGHCPDPGCDDEHDYTQYTGDGWINLPFSFAETPPCVNCLP